MFTQFREMTTPLATFLGGVFGRPGLILHGNTAVKKPQGPGSSLPGGRDGPVLRSVAEGRRLGFGLTAASHVVHFDRWWNPAVENQATDRAFPDRPEEERHGS